MLLLELVVARAFWLLAPSLPDVWRKVMPVVVASVVYDSYDKVPLYIETR